VLGQADPAVQPAQRRGGPPVGVAGRQRERGHDHAADQGGVEHDGQGGAQPEPFCSRAVITYRRAAGAGTKLAPALLALVIAIAYLAVALTGSA